ncbi:unnamed protein product [Penicillium pancosmium]
MEDLNFPLPLANNNLPSLQTNTSLQKRTTFISSDLTSRYTTVSIPASYGGLTTGPPPGTVAGIVLGSVGGVIIVLYLTFLALNPGGIARGGGLSGGSSSIDEEVVVRSRRGAASRRSDVIEVVEERGGRPRSYRRPPSHDQVIVEESVTGTTTSDGRDFVEVLEEESSGVSSVEPSRRGGRGYRSVDPLAYGGGSSQGSRFACDTLSILLCASYAAYLRHV